MDTTALPFPASDYALRMRCWELVREFLRELEDDMNNRVSDDEDTDE